MDGVDRAVDDQARVVAGLEDFLLVERGRTVELDAVEADLLEQLEFVEHRTRAGDHAELERLLDLRSARAIGSLGQPAGCRDESDSRSTAGRGFQEGSPFDFVRPAHAEDPYG